jgi:hypothetical protein
LNIAVGCTGGRHRSVAIANWLAETCASWATARVRRTATWIARRARHATSRGRPTWSFPPSKMAPPQVLQAPSPRARRSRRRRGGASERAGSAVPAPRYFGCLLKYFQLDLKYFRGGEYSSDGDNSLLKPPLGVDERPGDVPRLKRWAQWLTFGHRRQALARLDRARGAVRRRGRASGRGIRGCGMERRPRRVVLAPDGRLLNTEAVGIILLTVGVVATLLGARGAMKAVESAYAKTVRPSRISLARRCSRVSWPEVRRSWPSAAGQGFRRCCAA